MLASDYPPKEVLSQEAEGETLWKDTEGRRVQQQSVSTGWGDLREVPSNGTRNSSRDARTEDESEP